MHIDVQVEGSTFQLVKMAENDIEELWQIVYAGSHPEWVKWDTPYPLQQMDFRKYSGQMTSLLKQGFDKNYMIKCKGSIIGQVYYDWAHESSSSLEIGIGIYRNEYHRNEVLTAILKSWMDHLFLSSPTLRVGLTTWSGNERLIECCKELGMITEGRIRKSRCYHGRHYDTVIMGILREEWEASRLPT